MQKIITLMFFVLALASCATQRPVLYPNQQLNRGGSSVANRDIDDCMHQAESYVSSYGRAAETAKDVAAESGTSAAVGAAAGAAGGSIVGRAGTGAAVGAAGGAAAGATRELIHGLVRKQSPSAVYKNFVNRCLREKGYEPIGWN